MPFVVTQTPMISNEDRFQIVHEPGSGSLLYQDANISGAAQPQIFSGCLRSISLVMLNRGHCVEYY